MKLLQRFKKWRLTRRHRRTVTGISLQIEKLVTEIKTSMKDLEDARHDLVDGLEEAEKLLKSVDLELQTLLIRVKQIETQYELDYSALQNELQIHTDVITPCLVQANRLVQSRYEADTRIESLRQMPKTG